jgi:hypothetical protein
MVTGVRGLRELEASMKKPRGLGLGLLPVRAQVDVRVCWWQEAEWLVRSESPFASEGSPTDVLQSPRFTGGCCLIGSASRRPRAGSTMSRQSKVGLMNSMV